MDIFSCVCSLYILFILACIIIIVIADSDILTFLYERYGKDPADKYKGKVIWVTGASSGIGEGLAKAFAKCGAKLVLSARREDELIRVKKDCLTLNPSLTDKDILVLPLDMTNLSTHAPSFEKIISHFGKLDVLISNAGRSQRAHWHEVDLEVDRELFELNVFSVIHMNRIVVKYFLKMGQGQLGVTSSVAGKLGMPLGGTYSGSKHALQGYFEGLRAELYGKNIDITLFVIGPVYTQLLNAAFSSKVGESVNQSYSPKENRMTAERCADLALVAMTNGLDEAWISKLPIIPALYLKSYVPFLASKIMKVVGARYAKKLGLGTDSMKKD